MRRQGVSQQYPVCEEVFPQNGGEVFSQNTLQSLVPKVTINFNEQHHDCSQQKW